MATELEDRFNHHPPSSVAVGNLHAAVRAQVKNLALDLDMMLPPCREKALVMTKLEEALFWANAGIARNCNAPVATGEGSDYRDDRDQT